MKNSQRASSIVSKCALFVYLFTWCLGSPLTKFLPGPRHHRAGTRLLLTGLIVTCRSIIKNDPVLLNPIPGITFSVNRFLLFFSPITGLVDDQQKVRTITALALAALAEAATPYGIESFDSVLKPLWKGIRQHRGKVRLSHK